MPMTEVFQHVRAQYESKPRPKEEAGPGHAKVVARDEKWFITELLDKWKVDYERRRRHHHTGYFSLNHVPYKTFANLKHTDVYDLLGDHLGILMNRHYAFMQHYSRNQPTAVKTESPDTSELHNTIVVVCDEASGKNKKVLPPSKNGGLTNIQATLSSDIRVLHDIAAGSSFREALFHKTDDKDSSKEEKAANDNQQDIILKDLVQTAIKTERMIAVEAEGTSHQRKNTKTVGPNLYVALAAVHFKNHTSSGGANKPGLRQLKEAVNTKRRQQRHTMAKLKSVYAVLCCLYNIKSRDLRNQEPLSYSAVKALATKPLHSLTKNLPHHFQHHLHVEVHHHPSSSPQLPRRHSLGPAHRGAMASRHVKLDGPEYVAPVETWEELLHLHKEAEKLQSSSSSFICNSSVAPPTTTSIQRPSRMGSSSVHTHQKSHKVLPPWQRQVVFVKSKNESLKRDPAQKLQDCIDSFQCFKSEMSQHVKSALEDREYQLHMQKHLLTKMEHLVLGANMDVCLESMREQTYLIQSQERAEERNKPAWFSFLEKEVKTTFDVWDKEVGVMIEKLKQFTHVDIDAVPHVMEKMCLLIMSLPASQLSIQPVMSAIEFVLEHVLKQSPKLLTQLKNLRKLPPITTELQSTPVYVFGHRV